MNVLRQIFIRLPVHMAKSAVAVFEKVNPVEILTYVGCLGIVIILLKIIGDLLYVKEK